MANALRTMRTDPRTSIARLKAACAHLRARYGDADDHGSVPDMYKGARLANQLLRRWDAKAVGKLVKGLDVSAEWYVTKDGGVDLGAHFSAGSLRQLAALSIGEARQQLHEEGQWESYVKQCKHPRCQKWFFDKSRKAIQKFCCTYCGNDYGQKKKRNLLSHVVKASTPCTRC